MTGPMFGKANVVLDKASGREAWHVARAGRVTASAVPRIMGVSSYGDAASVLDGDKESTIEMRLGLYLEAGILDAAAHECDIEIVTEVPAFITSPAYYWLGCSLDGVVVEDGNVVAPIDAKLTNAFSTNAYIVREYGLQVRTQAFIMELDRALLAVCRGGQSIDIIEVEVDREGFERDVIPVLERFHRVQMGELTLDEAEMPYAWGTVKTSATPGLSTDLTYKDTRVVERYRRAKAAVARAEARADEVGDLLRARLGPAENGLYKGQVVVSWRASDRNDVDVKRLRSERPDIADEFTKTTTLRRLLLHGS